ncbi:AfsR/SARP family transcriptional regulator [Longispora albida]|uniref:AfsR/SARP family transcriptional regulator n=1 Tax=Longispora albida TaxID=203523 RepID=UPI0003767371|nr:BTAD domain-containing putative transcriptional regulator [Longispora albida]
MRTGAPEGTRARGKAGPATLHLLGGPYVTQDGNRIKVPEGSKRLLAFMALRRGRVERCHAAGALWPLCTDRRAAGNLRSALWRLKAADIDVFDSDKWSLELREDVAVDVHVIGEWAARLMSGRPRPDDLTIAGRFEGALDLLPGCYDDWALTERERMRQRMLHALEALSRLLSGMGRHGEAVEAAMMAINSEPLRESAQRVLLEAHIEEDNWVEARRGFAAYRDLLRRELGVEPSRDLAVLVRWREGLAMPA